MADDRMRKDSKSRKTYICNKCKLNKEERDTILCSNCKKRYDFDCIGISDKLYRLMTQEKKRKLRCGLCTIQDTKMDKPVMAVTTCEEKSNITLRKKSPLTLKTTNLTPNISKNKSQDTLLNYSSCDEELSLSERLSRSEDFATLGSCDIEELNEQVAELRSNLLTTQQELENTIIENNDLKRQINKLNKEIKLLKDICQAPTASSTNNNTPLGKDKTKRLLCFSPRSIATTSSDITNDIIITLQGKITELEKQLSEAKKEITELYNQINASFMEKNNTSSLANRKKSESYHSKTYQQLKTDVKTPQKRNTLKRNLIVLSTLKSNGILKILQHSYSQDFDYCHYSKPGAGILELLHNIEEKLRNFKRTDCCIILIGEADFKVSQNNKRLICCIRELLQRMSLKTNIVVCAPIYVCGSTIYNSRVEDFNNLLFSDMHTYRYGFLYDTNKNLNLEMFCHETGMINNFGLRHILYDLKEITKYITNVIGNMCSNKGFHDMGGTVPNYLVHTPVIIPTESNTKPTKTLLDYFPIVKKTGRQDVCNITNKFFLSGSKLF